MEDTIKELEDLAKIDLSPQLAKEGNKSKSPEGHIISSGGSSSLP
jgi:hypothetical protein